MQYSDREMSQLSFDHLLNLSFAFHMRRKTGELLRILDRGAAINHTLEASPRYLLRSSKADHSSSRLAHPLQYNPYLP
jgi:hypothetical protein